MFDISITAEQLQAAAAWATAGATMAPVELLAADRMLLVTQGDDRTAFDTGGEPGATARYSSEPLDRLPVVNPVDTAAIGRLEAFTREAWGEGEAS